ncbi:MAG: porphobilinogen synthase [Legionellales bacterium]|nr:porphobilinogen synthase [Legionellales bacterium]|tara:strand:- start:4381 stop:5376 length:996 start_codon:yes stop_codon:yes gene_type:complete
MTSFPETRLRRLRQHPKLRDLVRETRVSVNDLILPLFIHHDPDHRQEIASMPGQFQWGLNQLETEISDISKLGIPGVLLFGIPAHKDDLGSDSYSDNGIIQQAIQRIKSVNSDLLVISDVCFCEYTSHGHCGVIDEVAGRVDVDNDKTLELLAKQAVSHAEAGADVVAPSGMMDGMVTAIRSGLDAHDYQHIPILSYAVKYSSSFYGPFREAAEGAPQFGDRKTYQMDVANSHEALREADSDVYEGADMLMVKPAMAYLDIIHRVKQAHPDMPLGAYQVSGEYAMIKAAARDGLLDEQQAMHESLIAIKRAGADFIISYFAKNFVEGSGSR